MRHGTHNIKILLSSPVSSTTLGVHLVKLLIVQCSPFTCPSLCEVLKLHVHTRKINFKHLPGSGERGRELDMVQCLIRTLRPDRTVLTADNRHLSTLIPPLTPLTSCPRSATNVVYKLYLRHSLTLTVQRQPQYRTSIRPRYQEMQPSLYLHYFC
jgi:hypothetical protein